MKIYILGRQPELSKVELEVLGVAFEESIPGILLVSNDPDVSIDKLGGTIKLARVIERVALPANEVQISDLISKYLSGLNLDQMTFAISWYGKRQPFERSLAKKIKKKLSVNGKVRFVLPRPGRNLNAAAVLHNKLAQNKSEILVVANGKEVILAATEGIQNIDSYSKRDYSRPCRDKRVGMLPPKLSQILISLTGASDNTTIVDPFCGSGGLLMEASLMHYSTFGSDNEQVMVDCTKTNLAWIQDQYQLPRHVEIGLSDARSFQPPTEPYVISTEGYLGTNFSAPPSPEQVSLQKKEIAVLYTEFLTHVSQLENLPTRVVLCAPVWYGQAGQTRLGLIDQIGNLGYTMVEFSSADTRELIYHREDQFIGRQILVLKIGKKKV